VTRVEVHHWRPGFKTISFMKLLKQVSGIGLADAKHLTDTLLEKDRIEVDVRDGQFEFFLVETDLLGASARVVPGGKDGA
jgi:hypothetical protein